EGADATFEMVVAGMETSDGSDIAIMMVEAGGTENSWSHYQAGAPKVTEEVIAGGIEASKRWIRESIDAQLELIEKVGGKKPTMEFPAQVDYSDAQYEAV